MEEGQGVRSEGEGHKRKGRKRGTGVLASVVLSLFLCLFMCPHAG